VDDGGNRAISPLDNAAIGRRRPASEALEHFIQTESVVIAPVADHEAEPTVEIGDVRKQARHLGIVVGHICDPPPALVGRINDHDLGLGQGSPLLEEVEDGVTVGRGDGRAGEK